MDPKNFPLHIKLKYFREQKGLSQQEVADLLKTTKTSISQYETGKHQPTLYKMQKLEKILGVQLVDIEKYLIDNNLNSIVEEPEAEYSNSRLKEKVFDDPEILEEYMRLISEHRRFVRIAKDLAQLVLEHNAHDEIKVAVTEMNKIA